jgi:hypothetical protein
VRFLSPCAGWLEPAVWSPRHECSSPRNERAEKPQSYRNLAAPREAGVSVIGFALIGVQRTSESTEPTCAMDDLSNFKSLGRRSMWLQPVEGRVVAARIV